MIYLYSGTPGSGKSLHMARDIINKLTIKKQTVIGNFPINEDVINKNMFGINKKIGKYIYVDNTDLTVKYLINFAMKNNVMGKEGQVLLCIDECQVLFNPREYQKKDRLSWIKFFTQHRKLGYNVILVSQNDRLIDRQIRSLIEYEVKHRKVNNFKIGQIMPVPLFAAVTYWYGVRERIGVEFFTYRKKYAKLYDSFKFFDDSIYKIVEDAPSMETVSGGARDRGGGPGTGAGLEKINDKLDISR